MSVCPKPDTVKVAAKGPAAKFTANAPAPRTEACNTSVTTTVSQSGNATSTTVYVAGPAGPKGDKGDPSDVFGFKWEGEWEAGKEYVKQSAENRNGSVVQRYGKAWMCIEDHTSETKNGPMDIAHIMEMDESSEPTEWELYWQILAGANAYGESQLTPDEKSWFEKLTDIKDGIFDWIENADLGDWLKAGAVAAGVIWAGSKVSDMMAGDPEEDSDADQRYTGSPGFAGSYQAPSLRTVVSSLCDYADITYDASKLSGSDVCEFTIGQSTSVRGILEQLSLAYQFDMVNSGGVLKFIPRHAVAIRTIELSDMGYSDGGTPPAPYTAKRFQGIDLPKQVTLTYFAADVDYNEYSQNAELFTYEEGQNVELRVPVTLSHTRAKQLAELSLVNSHLERMNYKFNTTYKFIDVEPGDILNSPMGLIRILKIAEMNEGILEFEACDAGDDAALLASTMNVQAPAPLNNKVVKIGKSGVMWIDPTNLNDQDKSVRIYAAVHGFGAQSWTGAAIYMSEDNGQSYEQIGSSNREATLGIVESPVPNADYHVWDLSTQIVVKLKTGTLLPKSEIAVLNGDNFAQIGQELIGFCNADLIGDKTYRLSKLLRGRQGTESFVGTHKSNELFALVDAGLIRIDLDDADRGTTKKFKVVTIGSSLDVTDEEDVQIISNNTRAWSIYGHSIYREANSWKVTWKGRVRFDNKLKDFSEITNDEDFGGFGVAVLDDNDNTKSTQVVLTPSFTYTGAQQIADFGHLKSNLRLSIVPMSKKWGGGYPTIINS